MMPVEYYIYDNDSCLAYFRVDNWGMQLHKFEAEDHPVGRIIYERAGQWYGSLDENEIP